MKTRILSIVAIIGLAFLAASCVPSMFVDFEIVGDPSIYNEAVTVHWTATNTGTVDLADVTLEITLYDVYDGLTFKTIAPEEAYVGYLDAEQTLTGAYTFYLPYPADGYDVGYAMITGAGWNKASDSLIHTSN